MEHGLKIGQKVKGFDFSDDKKDLWVSGIKLYTGSSGVVESIDGLKNEFTIRFKDGCAWCYPLNLWKRALIGADAEQESKEEDPTKYQYFKTALGIKCELGFEDEELYKQVYDLVVLLEQKGGDTNLEDLTR